MTERLATAAARRPGLTLFAWLVAVVASLGWAAPASAADVATR